MRLVKAERQSVSDRVPNPWSIFKSPEELGGDRSTHGRRRLNEGLEGTLEVWRDPFVQVVWRQPATDRKADRNGYCRRKTWPTALGTLHNLRVPRCREPGLTRPSFARLEDHRQAWGDSVIDRLPPGVRTRRVEKRLEQDHRPAGLGRTGPPPGPTTGRRGAGLSLGPVER